MLYPRGREFLLSPSFLPLPFFFFFSFILFEYGINFFLIIMRDLASLIIISFFSYFCVTLFSDTVSFIRYFITRYLCNDALVSKYFSIFSSKHARYNLCKKFTLKRILKLFIVNSLICYYDIEVMVINFFLSLDTRMNTIINFNKSISYMFAIII